jgi:hypothetical protein
MLSVKLKDSVTTKATVDAAKGRKPWGLTAKSYAPHPVSPRPRKQQNDTRGWYSNGMAVFVGYQNVVHKLLLTY